MPGHDAGIVGHVRRNTHLRINYRNTTEVLALAMDCAEGILTDGPVLAEDDMPLVMPQSAGRSGPVPTLRRFDSGVQEASYVADRIADLLARGRSADDIAIFARHRKSLDLVRAALEKADIVCSPPRGERRVPATGPCVKLTTLHSSKGLEYPVVFLVALDRLDDAPAQRVEEMRLLYVGMTRATHRLALSAVGNSKIVDRVEQGVARVAQAYQ